MYSVTKKEVYVNTRTPIVWVWRVFKLLRCKKGMQMCAYIAIKLIELEVKHELKRDNQ